MADTNTGLWARAKAAAKKLQANADAGDAIREADYSFGYDSSTVASLMGSGKRTTRSRIEIYQKWHYMMGDPIVSSALRLHVTQALGGHETTGDVVFIEPQPDVKDGKRLQLVEELQAELAPLFNRIAHTLAYNAAGFGDAYARPITIDKQGVVDVYVGDLLHPPLVQPYERCNTTMGFVVSTGEKQNERLTLKQLVRMKMPRMNYIPQMRALESAQKIALREDDAEAWPMLPALVGGSFLEAAEEPYDHLMGALLGMVGQRILSSIDETMIGVNTESMTKEQRSTFLKSLTGMLTLSKSRAAEAVKQGRPITERFFHVIPTFNEKQMTTVTPFQGSNASGAGTNIEDVMLQARLLASALGIDLSMLGFADQLSGGLGDGGFFRTSAQAAERSRILRGALTDVFNDLVDLHTAAKYGWTFPDGERPYLVTFYGSISALESEKQASRERSMNASALAVQVFQQLKELGLKADSFKLVMARMMELDDDIAEQLSKALEEAKAQEGEQGFGHDEPGQIPAQNDNGGSDDEQ